MTSSFPRSTKAPSNGPTRMGVICARFGQGPAKSERPKPFRRAFGVALASCLIGVTGPAAAIDIDDIPPFAQAGGVAPNIFLALSNNFVLSAGIVRPYSYVTEGLPSAGLTEANAHLRVYASSEVNNLYYNPAVEYRPPLDPDGDGVTQRLGNAVFAAAWSDPFTAAGRACAVNLGSQFALQRFDAGQYRCLDIAYLQTLFALDASNYLDEDGKGIHGQQKEPGALPSRAFVQSSSYLFPEMPLRQTEDGDFVNDDGSCDVEVPDALPGQPFIKTSCGEAQDPRGSYTFEQYALTVRMGTWEFPILGGQGWTLTGVQPLGPAYYYVFDEGNSVPETGDACSRDADILRDACYTWVKVGSDEDIANGWYDSQVEAQTNFANWFSYYRTLRLAVVSSLTEVLVGARDANVRVSYLDGADDRTFFFNGTFTPPRPEPMSEAVDGILASLWARTTASSFLAHPIQAAGEYLRTDTPYLEDPGDASSLRSCRRNILAVFSGGSWLDTRYYLAYGLAGSAYDAIAAQRWGDVDAPSEFPETGFQVLGTGIEVDEYTPRLPYADANKYFPSELAFYYWANDLRPDDTNDVPGRISVPFPDIDGDGTADDLTGDGAVDEYDVFWDPRNDPATWQHLNVYTVSFEVRGNLSFPGAYPDLFSEGFSGGAGLDQYDLNRDPVNPGNPEAPIAIGDFLKDAANTLVKADDLWHTAINARGSHFRAKSANELTEVFREIIDVSEVTGGPSSAAAAGLTSGSLGTSSAVYLSLFEAGDWSGDVRAFRISLGAVDGSPCPAKARGELCDVAAPYWSAQEELDLMGPDERRIVSLAPDGTKLAFDWDSLSAVLTDDQIALWGASDAERAARLQFIRGSRVDEGAGFRRRNHLLGDVIYSAPLFVGPPSRIYPDVDYGEFRGAPINRNRPKMVYFGANDGMLHAVYADGDQRGQEAFAFVPSAVWDKLPVLADVSYGFEQQPHDNFVDGPLVDGDVKIGDAWHTMLVGAMGRGAKAVYAIDVTDPDVASEADARDTILANAWGLSDADDADMGNQFAAPAIARVAISGCADADPDTPCVTRWVALFGNGYNSGTGKAVLYVVDVANGDILHEIDTGVGDAGSPNGLSGVTAVDGNGDFVADFAYAGDLKGNVWKFNLHTNELAIEGSPLFTATDSAGAGQPITSKVAVARHPTGLGTLVLFGTGKFLGSDDVADRQVQTFYGIWDRNEARGSRTEANLLEQRFELEVQHESGQSRARTSSTEAIVWKVDGDQDDAQVGWFIDLKTPVTGDDGTVRWIAEGERVVSDPIIEGSKILFTSVLPSEDPCKAGGDSWVTALDLADGSRPSYTPFDFNQDQVFDSSDLVQVDGTPVVGSSIRLGLGVYGSPASMVVSPTASVSYVSTSEGELVDLRTDLGLYGRVWQELR